MRPVALLSGLAIGMTACAVRAEIYGYVDADGIAHFSSEKKDERYQLFSMRDSFFDSSQAGAAPAPAMTARQTSLQAYLSGHPNLKKYEPLLHRAAVEFALDPALLKAVMAAESGFNPAAISPRGAIGLMQVMPETAQRYGLQADRKKTLEQKLADPEINIRLAARYLRDLHKMFPAQPDLVLASYNAGEGAVQKYSNRIPPYPETRNYVQLVTEFWQLYKALSKEHAADARQAPKRIQMTIPARSNMPAAPFE